MDTSSIARALRVLCMASLVAVVGCSGPDKVDEGPRKTNVDEPRTIETDASFWASNVEAGPETTVVTDSIEVRDTEQNAITELTEKALRRSVELAIRDILQDNDLYDRNRNEIERVFVMQFQKYIVSHKVQQAQRFGDGRKLGAKIQVVVDRSKLTRELTQKRILKQQKLRIIVSYQIPPKDAAEDARLNAQYLTKFTAALEREFQNRGFETKPLDEVKSDIAVNLNEGDERLQTFIDQFIQEPNVEHAGEERFGYPLLLLRTQGRVLVSFSLETLEKRQLAYYCSIRATAFDMLNQKGIDTIRHEDSEVVGDGTLEQVKERLVLKALKKAIEKLGQSFQELLMQERPDMQPYVLRFKGWSEKDMQKLDSLLIGFVGEEVFPEYEDNGVLTVRADLARGPVPLRDQVLKSLGLLGFKSKPVRPKKLSDGVEMVFEKE